MKKIRASSTYGEFGEDVHPNALHTQQTKIGRPTLARACCGWEPCICEQLALANRVLRMRHECLSRLWGGLEVARAMYPGMFATERS